MKDEIAIEDIKILRNIRTEIGDVSELMSSIRENGLLHAIGVVKSNDEYILLYGHRRFTALKKLGRKALVIGKEVNVKEDVSDVDRLVLNIVENFHTKPNNPLEFGKACSDLKEMGLNISEIGVRLSAPKSKILTALTLLNDVPKSHQKDVSYVLANSSKRGKLSATVASALAYFNKRYKISKPDLESLFNYAKENELSTKDARIIGLLLESGMKLKDALKDKDLYTNKQTDFIVRKDELSKMGETFTAFMRRVAKKEKPELFY
jgi:ParB/RepB/Spo0J family partition protein